MSSENTSSNEIPSELSANPGYAFGQIHAALRTAESHPDADTRTRAQGKIGRWLQVLEGMFSGTLQVGSRTPVKDTPAWATLAVLRGGFATGLLLAEGDLQLHERFLLARWGASLSPAPRAVINQYFLTDAGIAELQTMLQTGTYRINVPEEGCLLVVAWLLSQNKAEAAREILEEIAPYLNRLRFYPVLHKQPLQNGIGVHLQNVGETIADLQAMRISPRVMAQREAIQIWAGLSDRIVELWTETLNGDIPTLQTDANGTLVLKTDGQPVVAGGCPCQIYPEGWQARAQATIDEYHRQRKEHRLCRKPERSRTNFAFLRECLEIAVQDPKKLTGRQVGRIRRTLANIIHKRGLPSSEATRRLRAYQNAIAAKPTNAELAAVVIGRMRKLPQDEGLDSLGDVLMPVTRDEAQAFRVPVEQPLRDRFVGKVWRSLNDSLLNLISEGIIGSSEMLATVVPQLTVQATAAQFGEGEAGRLYGAMYRVFRRRRSLLLLNLQSQVKFGELPWVRAMDAVRTNSFSTAEAARQTLEQVVTAAITGFPQQILPNKLLQELRVLATEAKLELPFVDEVAADIFMGAFSEKFLASAKIAAETLQGTLYERYYGLDYARVKQMKDVQPFRLGGAPHSPEFFNLCQSLTGAKPGGSWVAHNGMIIEQEQILTTHNLVAVFGALDLATKLGVRLQSLARACFIWICHEHQQQAAHRKAMLHRVKNGAYAWRQMVFFLSLRSEQDIHGFLEWANQFLSHQSEQIQSAFLPAIQGLADAAEGKISDAATRALPSITPERFLGWTTQTHWLLSP